MILFTHPTGSQFSRAALDAFVREKMLFEFHTSVATYEDSPFKKYILPSLDRRRFDTGYKKYIKTYPYLEFTQRMIQKLNLSWMVPHEGQQVSMYDTCQYMDHQIARRVDKLKRGDASAIYAYEDMSRRSFESAKEKDLMCLYDLPIGHWRAYYDLLSNEQKLQPKWAETLTGFHSSEKKLQQKDQELELADHIFVASQFTADSLKYFPKQLKAQVHVVPYGFPNVQEKQEQRSYDYHRSKRPLRLLFIGGLSQRKGLSYLFEAVSQFGDRVELTVVGKKVIPNCRVLDEALEQCHQWIPTLPHHKVLELMRQSDLLLFPSLFEGFGLVMTEAMSQGTPVIATERTAAPDLMTDGEDGFLVRAGYTEDLIEKIDYLLSNPRYLEKSGKAARRTAAKRPWTVYGQELTKTINQVLQTEATFA